MGVCVCVCLEGTQLGGDGSVELYAGEAGERLADGSLLPALSHPTDVTLHTRPLPGTHTPTVEKFKETVNRS